MTTCPLVVTKALSLTLVLDRTLKDPELIVVPTILINFPSEVADELTNKILNPYAQAANCFVGMKMTDTGARVDAYVVATVPYNRSLQLTGLSLPGPCVCLIGQEAEISMEGIARFMPHYQARKKFTLGIGYQTGPQSITGSILNPKIWSVELDSMSDNARSEATRIALTTCVSAQTVHWN